jgi:two-component system, LuxR family, response regulator FixJ
MIYIIDDDASVRRAFLILMQSSDFDAQDFESAEEFFDSVSPADDDCIILDLHMAGMSGFDVLRNLSLREKKVPVIVVSAFDDAQNRKRARECGARAFFRKPVDDQALIDTINWVLEGKQQMPNGQKTSRAI